MRLLRRALGRLAPLRFVVHSARRARSARSLVNSGVFDRRYYEVQLGRTFGSELEAARHVGDADPREQLSIHPLVDTAWVDAHRRGSAAAPSSGIDALFVPGRGVSSTSPAFDVDRARTTLGLPDAAPAAVLAAFLRAAGPDTPLPVSEAAAEGMTLGEALRIAEHNANLVAGQLRRNRSRVRPEWDLAAEQAYKSTLGRPDPPEKGRQPRVAVVMPVYNRADVVIAAIRSVVAQTEPAWELLVVDDGSDDETPEVVAALAAGEPRIRLIRGEHRGVSAARNRGIAESTAPAVAFLDSDNEWEPDFLACMLPALGPDGDGIAYSAVRQEEDDGVLYLGEPGDRGDLLDGANFIDLNALVVRRELLLEVGGFDESLRRWVDYDLALRLLDGRRAVYVPVIGVRYDHRATQTTRITNSESRGWRDVALAKQLLKRDGHGPRVEGRVSVVILGRRSWEYLFGTIRSVLQSAGELDVEVVVIDNAGPRSISRLLELAFGHDPRIRIQRVARDRGYGLSTQLAVEHTTGEFLLFLNHAAVLPDGAVARLREQLTGVSVLAVQPLLRRADGAVLNAGLAFFGEGELPGPFLGALPLEDAWRAGRVVVSGVSSGCFMVRAVDLDSVGGISPLLPSSLADADLSLRLARMRPGEFRISLDTVVTLAEAGQLTQPPSRVDRAVFLELWDGRLPAVDADGWAAAGFRVSGRVEALSGIAPPFGAATVERLDTVPRWAIKTAVPASSRGDDWGDLLFAGDLARALEARGCRVAVDRREAAGRETATLDDVVLVLRGRVPIETVGGAVRLLWVISHPDTVTGDELRDFDHVFAASVGWAQRATERFGISVETLLQATDPGVFAPPADGAVREGVVFVGSTRGQPRPVVLDAIEAGLHPRVFGRGWERVLPPDALAVTLVAPGTTRAQTAALYAGAEIVLNDHWADMAAEGFLSNRLFDAVGSGAFVISDRVEGLADVFGDAVAGVSGLEELRAAADPSRRPPVEALAAASLRIRTEHRFEDRAQRLMEVATDVRRNKGSAPPRSAGPDGPID